MPCGAVHPPYFLNRNIHSIGTCSTEHGNTWHPLEITEVIRFTSIYKHFYEKDIRYTGP